MKNNPELPCSNLFEHLATGIIVSGVDERILLINRAMRNMLGLEKHQVEGLCISDILHPQDRFSYQQNCQFLQTTEDGIRFETRYLHKNGQPVTAQSILSLEKDCTAKPLYYISQTELVAANKVTNNPLITDKENLRLLLDHMPAMIGYWDSNLINRFGNKAYEEWFGVTSENIVGRHIREIIGEKLYALNEPYLQGVLSGEPQFFERTIVNFAGQERFTQASYLPDCSGDQIRGFYVLITDVTELKQTQKRVKESEACLRAIYDNLPFLAWMKDPDGRYLQANKHWLQVVGISDLENLDGVTDYDIWPKELAEHYREVDQKVMETRKQIALTEQAIDNGIKTWTETIKTPVIDDNGQVLGSIGIAWDITEKRNAEDQMRNYSERFRLASQAAAIGVCEWDINTGLANWNERMYEMFGIPQDAAVDYQTWARTVLAEDLPSVKTKVRNLVWNRQEMHWEFRIRRQNDGELRYIKASAIASCDSQGQIDKIVGVNLDVTEFKQIEIALLEKKAHLSQAQAQAHLGSWALDVFSNIVKWSDENYRIFGIPKGVPLTYEDFLETVYPADKSLVDNAWRAAMQGEPYDIQHRIIVDGKIKWIRERAELEFAADGSFLRGIGTSQDITELKEIARDLESSRWQLRQLAARREKAREEERKRIAQEVHDELGQMLTALRLEISLLRMEFAGNHPQLANKIHNIMELIDKTIQVTRDVATSLRPSAIEMGIVPALEWLTRKFSEQSGIECELFYPQEDFRMEEESAIVVFRITQESLTNVLRHAQADKVRVSITLESEHYSLKIEDNGRGFDLNVPKRNQSFGLIGIQERSIMLGGEASISSSPGNGTLVKVRIPINPARQSL